MKQIKDRLQISLLILNIIKVNESRYKLCGVTPHFSKSTEKIIEKR